MAASLRNRALCSASESLRESQRGHFQRGITLIEVVLVMGIIAAVIVTSVLTLGTTLQQRRVSQGIVDVISIHTAVTKWANGGLIFYGETLVIEDEQGDPLTLSPDPRNLVKWSQIASLLPSPFQVLAEAEETLILTQVNPWGGDYEIKPPLPSKDPNTPTPPSTVWMLVVHDIPLKASEIFVSQLINGDIGGTVTRGGENEIADPPHVDVRIKYGE